MTLDLPDHPQATVLWVKEQIEATAGILFEQQRILSDGAELPDNEVISAQVKQLTLLRCEPNPAPAGTLEAELAGRGYTQIRRLAADDFASTAVLLRGSQGGRAVADIVDLSAISNANLEHSEIVRLSKAWVQVQHPCILPTYDEICLGNTLCRVVAYHGSGNLATELRARQHLRQNFPEEQIWRWLAQATLALQYLHGHGLVHRDLRLESCLLSDTGDLMLCPGKIVIAPASIRSSQMSSAKPNCWRTDMWHLGFIFWKLCTLDLTGELNGIDGPHSMTLSSWMSLCSSDSFPEIYSTELRKICEELLSFKAGSRPKAADIIQRPCMETVLLPMHGDLELDSALQIRKRHAYTLYAGCYSIDDAVEFYSVSHKEWLAAFITAVDDYNRIKVDLKPNTWISMDVQEQRVRTRRWPQEKPLEAVAGSPVLIVAPELSDDDVTIFPQDKFELVHKRDGHQWQCIDKKADVLGQCWPERKYHDQIRHPLYFCSSNTTRR